MTGNDKENDDENGNKEWCRRTSFGLPVQPWQTDTARRPDLILASGKKICIYGMACLMQMNIEAKYTNKLAYSRRHAFEVRERRQGYVVTVVPSIVGALFYGIKEVTK